MNTSTTAADEVMRLSGLLDQGLDYLKTQTRAYATAEKEYRKGKAQAWVKTAVQTEGRKMLAAEREDMIDAETADLREARDLADGMRQAALEAVRSRRAQISALQTLMNGYRAEAEFVRTGGGRDS